MNFNKTPMEAHRYQSYVHHIQKERATVYNALNLTDDQIKLREDLIKENTPIYNRKFNELTIEKLLNEENKIFKKSLTREQRSKYSMIKKLEEKDYKEAAHKKDYYKSNPKMVPFGDPKFMKHGPRPEEIPTPRPVLPPKEIK